MITKELIEYIIDRRNAKIEDSDIANHLLKLGWSKDDIDLALSFNSVPKAPFPPVNNKIPTELVKNPVETKNSKSSSFFDTTNMWDGFIHALMFISMYIAVFSLIIFVFKTIDYYFNILNYPYDYIERPYGTDPNISVPNTTFVNRRISYIKSIRYPLSSIVVAFPLFFYFLIKVRQLTKNVNSVRKNIIRKVFTYITLLISFLTLVFSLINLIYNLLSGTDILVPTVLKIIFLLITASVIFGYFLNQVKIDRSY